MLAIPKIINNDYSVDDVIINYFGISPEKINNIIDKQKQMAKHANVSTEKYYDKMKNDDEFMAQILESKRKYYHKNKERLRQYYIDRLNDNDDIKERYTQNKRVHYEENKEAILERQRIAYQEKNKDKPKLKVGRKPKNQIQNETTTYDSNNNIS